MREKKEIDDFLKLPTTVPGDVVSYTGPNQIDAWRAVVQNNNFDKNCLGKPIYLGEDPDEVSDEEMDYNSHGSSSNLFSYISDSDDDDKFGGKKTRKSKTRKVRLEKVRLEKVRLEKLKKN